jgi:hypothetical protein
MTKFPAPIAIFVACLVAWPATLSPALAVEPSSPGFVKGHSWGWTGARGSYLGDRAADSMHKLAETGANSVCISFATTMATPQTPQFRWAGDNPRMVTDNEIRHAIDLARKNHLKVILKPVINCDDGTWRAWVKFYRTVTPEEQAAGVEGELDPWADAPVMRPGEVRDLAKWDQWWACFRGFLLHYAKIAEEEHVEMLCLGCEMNSTEEFEDRWRDAIAEIRGVYRGALTYDVNHGRESQVAWWDAVDVISVSAYYAVPPREGVSEAEAIQATTSKEEIAAQLARNKEALKELSAKFDKPILFIETGVTNVRGCARYPWSHPDAKSGHPLDPQEQVNYYAAMFETFWDEPWFMGFAWWDWPARLYERDAAAEHRGFCVYGKPAEDIVRSWYAKPR